MRKKDKKRTRLHRVREMTADEAMEYLVYLEEYFKKSGADKYAVFFTYQYGINGDVMEYSFN